MINIEMIIQNAYGINTINGSHTIVNRLIISVVQKIIKVISSISMFFFEKDNLNFKFIQKKK